MQRGLKQNILPSLPSLVNKICYKKCSLPEAQLVIHNHPAQKKKKNKCKWRTCYYKLHPLRPRGGICTLLLKRHLFVIEEIFFFIAKALVVMFLKWIYFLYIFLCGWGTDSQASSRPAGVWGISNVTAEW